MNIQLLTPKFIQYKNNNNNQTRQNNMSLPLLRPLKQDTVQFTGTKKVAEKAVDLSKKKVFEYWNPDDVKNFKEIVKIAQKFEKPLEKFEWDLRKCLKNLISTDNNPDNIIMHGKKGVKSRVKTPRAIAYKANLRSLTETWQIEQMGDVGGARNVMRKSSFEDTDKIFDCLKDLVKQGYKIKEVENYRLNPKDSYVSQKTLDKFEKFCIEHDQYPEVKNRPIPNGYTAIHITFELSDGKLIELQTMGRDVENVKEVEDFFYKYRNNIPFDPKYKPIQRTFDKYMPTLDDFQKETLNRYIKDSYMNARHIPPRSTKVKFNPEKEFLPFPYSLPQKLSFENIYKMTEECQKASKKNV